MEHFGFIMQAKSLKLCFREVPEGVYISRSLPEALELLRGESFRDKIENINIIGGSSVYKVIISPMYVSLLTQSCMAILWS